MKEVKIPIIIADDEEDIRETYNVAFSSHGFEVMQASSGKDVLEWLEQKGKKIKLILTDIVMPEMDGFELLEKMQTDPAYKKIAVLVSTNLDSDADKKEALAMGARELFCKADWTPNNLAKEVHKFYQKNIAKK